MSVSKEDRIQDAANSVFLRYGYKRVTMNEIAEAVGISRPSLYLVFGSKEEVFSALLRRNIGRSIQRIREGMAEQTSSREKLRLAFEIWAVQSFDLMLRSPEAKELYDCGFEFARETMDWGHREFESTLTPHLKETEGLAPETLARLLSSAVRGFKQVAKDAFELRQLIDDVLRLIG